MEDRAQLQHDVCATHENQPKDTGLHDINFSSMESVPEPQLVPDDSKSVMDRLPQFQSTPLVSPPPTEPSPAEDASDQLYQPVLDEGLDDEDTLEDEEKNGDADDGELDELERLGELPLEELLRMYGGGPPARKQTHPRTTIQVESLDLVAGPSGVGNGSNTDSAALESSTVSASANDEDDWTTSSDDEGYTVEDEDKLAMDRSKLMKFLAKISGDAEGSDDSSSDDDFFPVHLMSMLKREVPVGPNRQIEPPKFDAHYDDVLTADFPDEVLQWAPRLPEAEVVEYLKAAYIQECELLKKEIPAEQLTQTDVADDEEFLKELLDCNYEKDEALRRCRRNFRPGRYESSKWSEKECEDFEAAIMDNWKKFNIVQAAVPTRTVKEVVEFYYRWKKSARFEPFLARVRVADGKSQHTLEEKVKLRMNGKKRPYDAMDAVSEDQLADSEKEKVPLEPRPKSARLDSINSASSGGSSGSSSTSLADDRMEGVSKTVEAQAGPSGS